MTAEENVKNFFCFSFFILSLCKLSLFTEVFSHFPSSFSSYEGIRGKIGKRKKFSSFGEEKERERKVWRIKQLLFLHCFLSSFLFEEREWKVKGEKSLIVFLFLFFLFFFLCGSFILLLFFFLEKEEKEWKVNGKKDFSLFSVFSSSFSSWKRERRGRKWKGKIKKRERK